MGVAAGEKLLSAAEFEQVFAEEIEGLIYREPLKITCHAEVEQMFGSQGKLYYRKIHFVLLDAMMEKMDVFARQFKQVIRRDKIIPNKERLIAQIEAIIAGKVQYLLLAEIPSVIKLNKNKQIKYNKIKQILEITAQLKK